MAIRVNVVFTCATLLAAAVSIASSIFLFIFVRDELTDLSFENGESQVTAAVNGVRGQIEHMQGRAQTHLRMMQHLASTNDVSSHDAVRANLLPTLQGFSAGDRGYDTPYSTMIDVFTFLYFDAAQHTATSIQSMACAYDFAVNVSYCGHTRPDGVTNEAYAMNTSVIPPIRSPDVLFTYPIIPPFQAIVEDYSSGRHPAVTVERALPWMGLDGKRFWYTSGVAVANITDRIVAIATSPESIARKWLPSLQHALGENSEVILVDSDHNVLATTIKNVRQLSECELTRQQICEELYAHHHPDPMIRRLFNEMWEPIWDDVYGADAPPRRATVSVDGVKYLVVTRQVVSTGPLRMHLIWATSRDNIERLEKRVFTIVTVVTAIIVFTLCALLVLCLAFVLQPMKHIGRRMRELSTLSVTENEDDGKISGLAEVADIQRHFRSMNAAIVSFGKYVPRDIVQSMLTSGEGVAVLGLQLKNIVAYFVDIADFTVFCDHVDPDTLTPHMSHFFELVVSSIHLCGGTVDKYLGDCVMALWGAPTPTVKKTTKALVCALHTCTTMSNTLVPSFRKAGFAFSARIGMHCGDALVGNMGSEDRMNYSAMGNVVNTAARLESLGKDTGSIVLVSDDFFREVNNEDFMWRHFAGSKKLRGRRKPVVVHEVLGFNPAIETKMHVDTLVALSKAGLVNTHGNSVASAGSPLVGEPTLVTADRAYVLTSLALQMICPDWVTEFVHALSNVEAGMESENSRELLEMILTEHEVETIDIVLYSRLKRAAHIAVTRGADGASPGASFLSSFYESAAASSFTGNTGGLRPFPQQE